MLCGKTLFQSNVSLRLNESLGLSVALSGLKSVLYRTSQSTNRGVGLWQTSSSTIAENNKPGLTSD